jgi:hypothetical protein
VPYIQGGFVAAPVLISTVNAALRRFRKGPLTPEDAEQLEPNVKPTGFGRGDNGDDAPGDRPLPAER